MVIGNPMIFRQLPLEMALRKMVELGYDALELWPPQIGECRTPQLRRRLAEHIASLGLKLVRLNAADPDYFKALNSPADVPGIVAGLKADIDAAAELGMSQLLTYEGRRPPKLGREEIFGWVLDETVHLFDQALRYARTRDVSLSVEVHPFTLGIDLDWLIALCDRLDAPDFGVVYDCCHFGVGLPNGYIDAIRRLGPRIHHVHFSDSDQVSSELHYAPGAGCLDLPGIVAALKDINFRGTMMLDLWLYPLPEEGSRIGVPYVREFAQRFGLEVGL
jgi:sugar phosphate isomerase/epimerase